MGFISFALTLLVRVFVSRPFLESSIFDKTALSLSVFLFVFCFLANECQPSSSKEFHFFQAWMVNLTRREDNGEREKKRVDPSESHKTRSKYQDN